MQRKSVIFKLLAGSIAVFASTMPAHADLALAQKNACMACHAVDKKLVGPSYQSVVEKYAKEKDYVAKLAASIKAGGSGKYGPIPMPAQAALTDADATKLAKWILAGAK
jgi:cytochrome c